MNIKKGTKLIGVWGAMIPDSEGEVVEVIGNVARIAWDHDHENYDYACVEDIHEMGWRSVNGSPIGIFKKSEKSS